MLDGSKPYLAAADDRLKPEGMAFTPFSSRLGALLKELHNQLLVVVKTETHPVVLTRAVRTLAILVRNTPYQQLSTGYVSHIVFTLHGLISHRGYFVLYFCWKKAGNTVYILALSLLVYCVCVCVCLCVQLSLYYKAVPPFVQYYLH